MTPFTALTAVAAPFVEANVDTDKIIPKQFLKTIKRSGLGQALFHEVRYDMDDNPLPDFVLNKPPFDGAQILLGGENFGCGSSREHAVWALTDFGIRCVVAPSFADIFYNNCTKNGVCPAIVPADQAAQLAKLAEAGTEVTIDLPNQTITCADFTCSFEIDAASKDRLLKGLDDIAMTEQKADEIAAFEAKHTQSQPWMKR